MISTLALVTTWLVAALHLGFLVLESVLWTRPTGRRVFGLSAQDAETTRTLASNQGVYNGMLAAGLVWATLAGNVGATAFLLVYVAVVGAYGAATVKPRILLLQSGPALLALALWFLAR